MKKAVFLFLSLATISLAAQDPRPEVCSIPSRFERIEIVRMGPGTDMLEGLSRFIEENHILNGVVLAGIGSVTDYHFHVVSDKNLPPAEEYPKASVPMDLIAVQGYIFNKRVHAHITLSDENSVVGGHLEPGTRALTFFILTIGVLPEDLELEHLDSISLP
ncbi:MAG TPA: DNA-binding protein [Bacteroides sp.]|nr:DNA-binding protein [Bacteroides sp.]